MKARQPFVSVIIPVRNEARYIEACLRSLLRGGYPAARWEIILADGMSTDGTREIIARVAADAAVPIYIADNPRGTIPHALNLAIAGARGEIIIRAIRGSTWRAACGRSAGRARTTSAGR